jgi:hypothetical protein
MKNSVKLGRPVNPSSNRQIELAKKAELRAQGLIKRGRPVVEGSKNAVIKAARLEKINNGIELKKGRPSNPNSKRQQRIAELAAKKASGIFKLGRPKVNKIEIEVPTMIKVDKKEKVAI